MKENYFVYDFEGTSEPRNVFTRKWKDQLRKFLEDRNIEAWNGIIMLLQDMIKNIYDHAQGKGRLEVVLEGDRLSFLVRDYVLKSYDWAEIKKHGSTKAYLPGNTVNYDQGIRGNLITGPVEDLNCKLEIDTSAGFTYVGTMRVEITTPCE